MAQKARITVLLPDDASEMVSVLAKSQFRSKSGLIERLVRDEWDRHLEVAKIREELEKGESR